MALARWQATIVDESGNIQAAASVEVRSEASGLLVSIYSDRAGATPLSNPMTADSEGYAAFHVVGGAYKITAQKGSFARQWRYVGIGTMQEVDLAGGPPREVLSANRTYYVRADGSDSNTGLANTSGGAFLTLQKAADVAMALDLSIYNVTINVGAGTYAAGVVLGRLVGKGTVTFVGDTTTPSNVAISYVTVQATGWIMKGFKTTNTAIFSYHIGVSGGDTIFDYYQWDFGAADITSAHVLVTLRGTLRYFSSYTISGGAGVHWQCTLGGLIYRMDAVTVTLTGTPAFTYYVLAQSQSSINANLITFSGSATGTRYAGQRLSVIDTAGSGASYFPGNVSGSVDSTSVYA